MYVQKKCKKKKEAHEEETRRFDFATAVYTKQMQRKGGGRERYFSKKMQTMGNNKQECERRGVRRMKSIAGGIGTSTNTWQHTTKHFVL